MADSTGVTYVQSAPGTTAAALENVQRRLAESLLLTEMQNARQALAQRSRERITQLDRGGR